MTRHSRSRSTRALRPSADERPGSELPTLRNPEASDEARLAVVSLPLPLRGAVPGGVRGYPSQSVDVAWWPDSRSGAARVPRRRLMFVMGDGPLPEEFSLGESPQPAIRMGAPQASIHIVHKDHLAMMPREVGELQIRAGGRWLGLRLGLRWREEVHWWEWLRLETLWSGPLVTAYRAGGCIEVERLEFEDFLPRGHRDPNAAILRSPWLHRQNWLFAEAFVLCYANGVIQYTCRHVNNHRFDEGREQHDVTPLIGLRTNDEDPPLDERLDGRRTRFSLGDVALDLSDAATLVSPAHPGSLRREDGLVVYQPYEGIEIAGDHSGRRRRDGFIVRTSERLMPRGAARTVRFAASLSDAAPAVSRLIAPEWWYAACGDLWPDAVLPVHDAWDNWIEQTYERGVAARNASGRFDDRCAAGSWEGETPYAELLHYYRSGTPEHARRALRDAYYIADLVFDHATETFRMMGYPMDGATAPPLFRTLGMLFGHLETGDPYLLDCAESASTHWYWMDRHMWPRYAYGRDGASIRGLVFLWDYTGKEAYRDMARDAIGRLIQCQRPDGGYSDQGSGTGIHAASHLPVKPWMANLANDPIMDYLERWSGEEPELWRALVRYGDFLLRSAVRRQGRLAWPYQVAYGDEERDPWLELRYPPCKGRMPTESETVHGHKARALSVLSRRTGRPRYFDTWLEFFETNWASREPCGDSYAFTKGLQHMPYAQAHAWNARWRDGVLTLDPMLSVRRPVLEGTVQTPRGPVALRIRRRRNADGSWGWALLDVKADFAVEVKSPDLTPVRPRSRES